MVELTQIEFAFGRTPALRGIDLEVKVGEFLAIIGPNGAGKSTLLRLIAGLLQPTEGRIVVLGCDPRQSARQALATRVAYLSQSYRMAFPFTAIEVVLMGRYAHGSRGLLRRDSREDRDLAMAALKRCDVSELAERRIEELSGGEKRRVLIAQALCQEAELLLLDEPTAGLDPKHAIDLFDMVKKECNAGRSCIAVTHDLNLAARFADRILLLDQGAQVCLDSPQQVVASEAMSKAFSVSLQVGTLEDGTTPYVVPIS